MQEIIHQLSDQFKADLNSSNTTESIENLRIRYLGKQGHITLLSQQMRNVPPDQKPIIGSALNQLRQTILDQLQLKTIQIQKAAEAARYANFDPSLPGYPFPHGSIHPISQLLARAVAAFRRIGFSLASGPEIETEFHCFDALNTPPDHPARNELDTFYLPDGRLLRTHTSSVQIRVMQQNPPPIRVIAPGPAYRRDEIDATHLAQFHQLEGLCVGPDVSLADLKGTILFFLREMFGPSVQCRFRPHYFPFTEPSFEIDIRSPQISEEWMELAGCGMVHPAVFEAVCNSRGDRAYDPDTITGFAFGFGLD
ncbi:MAG: phenylalanine--tRNA ligase subunit alpha, partial [Chthoniobacterales bacterium]|nr:phenylalanine--tRNA ligase subunit alpha [Chthoniobacterales bacterium]